MSYALVMYIPVLLVERAWINMNILDFAIVSYGTVLYENHGILVGFGRYACY